MHQMQKHDSQFIPFCQVYSFDPTSVFSPIFWIEEIRNLVLGEENDVTFTTMHLYNYVSINQIFLLPRTTGNTLDNNNW